MTAVNPEDCSSATSVALSVEPNASSCVPTEAPTSGFKTSTTNSTSTPVTCVRRRPLDAAALLLLTTRVTRTAAAASFNSLATAETKDFCSAAPKVSFVYPARAYVAATEIVAGGGEG